MKYTARDESRVEAECYICHKTLIKSCILSYKQSGSVLLPSNNQVLRKHCIYMQVTVQNNDFSLIGHNG